MRRSGVRAGSGSPGPSVQRRLAIVGWVGGNAQDSSRTPETQRAAPEITEETGDDALLAAAVVWAAASARRDRLPRPAPAQEKLPGIRRALASPGASLHLARRAGVPSGFTLLVPRQTSVEIRYLAVAPTAWGAGLGSRLLEHVTTYAAAHDHTVIDLWVLEDNDRAVATYVRAGWRATDDVKSQIDTRRTERRFERRLG